MPKKNKDEKITQIKLQNSFPAITIDPNTLLQILTVRNPSGVAAMLECHQSNSSRTRFLWIIRWVAGDGEMETVSAPTLSEVLWNAAVRDRALLDELKFRIGHSLEDDPQESLF